MANQIISKSFSIPIDVGDKAVQSTVLRDGVEVKAPVLSTNRVIDFIDKLGPVSRFSMPRVLEQGIPAGVKVARGTVVDLTCVPATAIKVGLLETSHVALRDRTVATVANVIDADLAQVLASHETSTTLTQTDRAKVQTALTQLQVPLDETKPDSTFETAFLTLRDVQVFR
ncbi:MAG TPA: hypothetical protein VFT22_04690 [Kofleriaceae bacterium]|nr:hypothetical protein [Kofleriaceae bacterium]